jgi:primosomal protein N'
MRKCQPRNEADGIRRFLLRARAEKAMPPEQEIAAREVLDRFEQQVRGELRQLDNVLKSIRKEPGVDVFPLKETMPEQATKLAETDLLLEPFDQANLAAILGRAADLREQGETELCFCVEDADLQPWDRRGQRETASNKAI